MTESAPDQPPSTLDMPPVEGKMGGDLDLDAHEARSRTTARRTRRRSLAHPGRLRDIVGRPWFEPVVTVMAIVVLLGGLYAYTSNWPPLVVVESSSMQHGDVDVPGLINTGDLVLVKQVKVPSQVTTYVQGEAESPGYTTYGEYGDVLLYFPEGDTALTPVIHRAILWLDWNSSADAFSAPSLAPLVCGPADVGAYEILPPGAGTPGCVSPSDPNAPLSGTIELFNVGWQQVTDQIDLGDLATQEVPHSGFVTEGDDNCEPNQGPCTHGEFGVYDQKGCAITCALVEPAWVEGVARGMIPWFGAIKLWLSGDPQYVPPQTWDYLALTIVAILLLPTVVPKAVRHLVRFGKARRARPPEERSPSKELEPGAPVGASASMERGEGPQDPQEP